MARYQRNTLYKQLSFGLAGLVICAALLHTPQMLAQLSGWAQVLASVAYLGLYVLVASVTLPYEQDKAASWLGYRHMVTLSTWATLGISVALPVLVIGECLTSFVRRKSATLAVISFSEAALYVALLGSEMLIINVVYHAMGASLPYDALRDAQVLIAICVSVSVGVFAAQELGIRLTQESRRSHVNRLRRTLLADVFLIAIGLLLPLVLDKIGLAAFTVICLAIAAQATQQFRIKRTNETLVQRIQDISTLTHIGSAITSSNNLDDWMLSIHQEVAAHMDATGFFIADYDEVQQLVRYPLLYVDGQRQPNTTRSIENNLTDTVIKTGKALHYSAANALHQHLTPSQPIRSYMGFPLKLGDQLIGVMGIFNKEDPHAFDDVDQHLLETLAAQASLLLHNATLYENNTQMADNLAQINDALQSVMFNFDQQESMRIACELAIQITGAQKAAIFAQAPDTPQRLQLIQSIGIAPSVFAGGILLEQGYTSDAARSFPDALQADDVRVRSGAEAGLYRAYAEAPLRYSSSTSGFLAVYHDDVHFHAKPQLDLLTMLANQVTAALDNADLLHALEVYAAEQAQLVHLSTISSASLDLHRIIYDVCEQLRQMIDVQIIEIGVYAPEQAELRFYTDTLDRFEPQHINVAQIPELQSLLQPNVIRPMYTFHSDDTRLSSGMQEWIAQRNLRLLTLTPMVINREVVGVILLGEETQDTLKEGAERILEMATHQIAMQIHNARVHMLTEEALLQRLEQLALIEEIAQQISHALTLPEMVDNILKAAMQSTGAELAALALVENPGDAEMRVIWHEQLPHDLLKDETTQRVTEGILGQVFQTGQTLIVADHTNVPNYRSGTPHTYTSSLAVALFQGTDIIGVLNIESTKPAFFTEEHASFIKSLAGHAAISIQNSRLLSERERQIETLSALRTLSLDVVNVPQREPVAQAIVETARSLLGGDYAVIYAYSTTQNGITPVPSSVATRDGIPPIKLSTNPPIVEKVIDQAQIITIEDTAASTMFDTPPDYASVIAIPIRRHYTVHEVLCVMFKATRRFTDHDKAMVEPLIGQAASYLENAELNQTIRTSNDRMRAILDSTRDGILLFDSNGRLKDANEAAEALLQIDLRDNLDQPLLDILRNAPQNPGITALMEDYAAAGRLPEAEYHLVTDNDECYIQTHVVPVQGANRVSGELLFLRDVTDEKRLELYRNKIQDMVLHDLRSPIAAIISSMYLAQNVLENPGKNPQKDDTTVRNTLQSSLDSANHLLHLVETLRDLPNIAEMEIKPIDSLVEDIAITAHNAIAMSLRGANITVSYDIDERAALLFVDSDLIRRVFINLLHNAYKFTPENGQILISTDRNTTLPDYVRVLVSDTGPGIPADKREMIFKEFTQIDDYLPRSGTKGSGLGLNFCKLAVEAHGGSIWVAEDGPLKGATFAFTLPYSAAALEAQRSINGTPTAP